MAHFFKAYILNSGNIICVNILSLVLAKKIIICAEYIINTPFHFLLSNLSFTLRIYSVCI